MYTYEKMQLYSLENILALQRTIKTLIGYYWCYPENYEEEIVINPTPVEIEQRYEKGIMIGQETTKFIPHLYEKDIVKLNTGEVGIVIKSQKDEQHLVLLTKSTKYYVSLFDGDLFYTADMEVWVEQIGRMTSVGVDWNWNRYELPQDISMEELSILLNGMVISL